MVDSFRNVRVQRHRRIASTMFNEDVINMGRVLVLFAFTSQMGKQYPTDAWRFWDVVSDWTVILYFHWSVVYEMELSDWFLFLYSDWLMSDRLKYSYSVPLRTVW
jgi:hypothetical protein